jgi:hypothetical protein
MRTYRVMVTKTQTDFIRVLANSEDDALKMAEDEVLHRHPADECWDDSEYDFEIMDLENLAVVL